MHKIKHIISYVYYIYILYINSLLERGLLHIRNIIIIHSTSTQLCIASKFTDGGKCFIISTKSSAKPGKIQFLSVKARFFSSNRINPSNACSVKVDNQQLNICEGELKVMSS